jgi:hypothetical protein
LDKIKIRRVLGEPVSSSTQITRLKEPRRLWLFKGLGWLILGMSALVILINIPIFYQYVIDNSLFPYLAPEIIAIIRTIIRRFGEIIFLGTSTLILLRSREPKALLIGMFSAALGAAIGGSYIEVADFVDTWLLAIVLIVAALSSSLGILLVFILPDGEFFPKQGRWLVMLLTIVESLRVYLATVNYGDALSYILFLPLFLIGAIGLWAQARRYRDGSSVYRQQFKWVIFGGSSVLIGIALTLLGSLLLPREFRILSSGLDEVGGIVLAISLLFAILRYRLYDIDLFINRSLVYGAVFIGLALVFAGLLFLLQRLLQAAFPEAGTSPALILALLVVALLFHPVRRQIQHWIDRNIYHFRFDLNQLSEEATVLSLGGGLLGKSIGGFQLLEVIGRGGTSEVYRGVKDGRMAAIKILNLVHSVDEVSKKRFEREAELTERFRHPNIVHLHARGEVDGLRYLALEYIEGITLDKYIEKHEKLSLGTSLKILQDVGAALQYAHERNMVHRDIKPSNIMLRKKADGSQEAILMDLGLAKVMGESTTVTGIDALGTISYMSPEQIQEGRSVDKRSDIYSMAIMAYQMLTGQLPFSGSAGRILFGHINQPAPDPQELLPDLPTTVALAIQRAMAKSAEDRYPDIMSFLSALTV